MCHLVFIQHSCQHKGMVRLFCRHGDDKALCHSKQQHVVGRYHFGGRCSDCATRRWEREEDADNEAWDDAYEEIDGMRGLVGDDEIWGRVAMLNQRGDEVDELRLYKKRVERREWMAARIWISRHAFACLGASYPLDAHEVEVYEQEANTLLHNAPAGVQVLLLPVRGPTEEDMVLEDEAEAIREMLQKRKADYEMWMEQRRQQELQLQRDHRNRYRRCES